MRFNNQHGFRICRSKSEDSSRSWLERWRCALWSAQIPGPGASMITFTDHNDLGTDLATVGDAIVMLSDLDPTGWLYAESYLGRYTKLCTC